jgi:hypothetical protein
VVFKWIAEHFQRRQSPTSTSIAELGTAPTTSHMITAFCSLNKHLQCIQNTAMLLSVNPHAVRWWWCYVIWLPLSKVLHLLASAKPWIRWSRKARYNFKISELERKINCYKATLNIAKQLQLPGHDILDGGYTIIKNVVVTWNDLRRCLNYYYSSVTWKLEHAQKTLLHYPV